MSIINILKNSTFRATVAGFVGTVAVVTGITVFAGNGSPPPGVRTVADELRADRELATESRREVLERWGDPCEIDLGVVDAHSGEAVSGARVTATWFTGQTVGGRPETIVQPAEIGSGAVTIPVGCYDSVVVDLHRLPDEYEPYSAITAWEIRFEPDQRHVSHEFLAVRRDLIGQHHPAESVGATVWDITGGDWQPYEGAVVHLRERFGPSAYDPVARRFEPQWITRSEVTAADGRVEFPVSRFAVEVVLERPESYEIVGLDRAPYDYRPLPNGTGRVAGPGEEMAFMVRRADSATNGGETGLDLGEDSAGGHDTGDPTGAEQGSDDGNLDSNVGGSDFFLDDELDDDVDDEMGSSDCRGEDRSLNRSAGEIGRAVLSTYGLDDETIDHLDRRGFGRPLQDAVWEGELCESDVDELTDHRTMTPRFEQWASDNQLGEQVGEAITAAGFERPEFECRNGVCEAFGTSGR